MENKGETSRPYVNFNHLVFALNPPINVTLDKLFSLLDTIDVLDRDMLLSNTYFLLYVDEVDANQDEDKAQLQYENFKTKCSSLDIMDILLVNALVLLVLGQFYKWSDESHTDIAVESIKGFIDFTRKRGTPEAELEQWKIMSEAKSAQKKSDLITNRRLYNMFCDKIVRPLYE